jgi:hypothetical protein
MYVSRCNIKETLLLNIRMTCNFSYEKESSSKHAQKLFTNFISQFSDGFSKIKANFLHNNININTGCYHTTFLQLVNCQKNVFDTEIWFDIICSKLFVTVNLMY